MNIINTIHIMPNVTLETYENGLVFENDQGLVYNIYESMEAFEAGNEPLHSEYYETPEDGDQDEAEERAFQFLLSYKI